MFDIFDKTVCSLGEGALWHPERRELFWFDINNQKLYARSLEDKEARSWDFEEIFTAAGWIDSNTLLIASETGLWRFDINSGSKVRLVEIESDNPQTRSNDGRADPFGGFWIGTMGKTAELSAGAIYRYYKGELRKLFDNLTIPNAICFTPQGDYAYFTDTVKKRIQHVALDNDGWPLREPEIFRDLRMDGRNPDGAITDAKGNLWNAQWGSGRVAVYDPEGNFVESHEVLASQTACPALGGENFDILFITSASEELEHPEREAAGQTFFSKVRARGKAEPRVVLQEATA